MRIRSRPIVVAALVGSALTPLVVAGAMYAGSVDGLRWRDRPQFDPKGQCTEQRRNMAKRRLEKEAELQLALQRAAYFRAALTDPKNPHFAQARPALEAETNKERQTRSSLARLKPKGVGDTLARIALSVLLITAASLGVIGLVSRHASRVDCFRKRVLVRWRWRQFAILCAAFVLVGWCHGFWADVATIEQTRSSWSDFCNSPLAWLLYGVIYIPLSLVVAAPVYLLWELGRPELVPQLDLIHADEKCGAESYLLFLQTWAILPMAVFFLPALYWAWAVTREQDGFISSYIWQPLLLCAYAFGTSFRMGLRASEVRRNYRKAVMEAIAEQKFARDRIGRDPTLDFLGESWWKLPATVGALLAILWQIVELTGLGAPLQNLLQSP